MDSTRRTALGGAFFRVCAFVGAMALAAFAAPLMAADGIIVELDPPDVPCGYVASLLINEAPFPGERGYVSQDDTKAGMLAILWVLESRLRLAPAGYSQKEVAGVKTDDVIDIITGNGAKRQCEGFFKAPDGSFAMSPRVKERIDYLAKLANKRGKPGTFSSLLNYAKGLSRAYFDEGIKGADRFAGLNIINRVKVTGRAYSWMTDDDCFHPGGNFISIPDDYSGSLGGNRFFTLRKEKK